MFLTYLHNGKPKGKKIHIRKLLGFLPKKKFLAYLRNEKPKGKIFIFKKEKVVGF
jgi:hypothetical protein